MRVCHGWDEADKRAMVCWAARYHLQYTSISCRQTYTAVRRVGCPQRFDCRRARGKRPNAPPAFVGEIGTRQADIHKLIRRLHTKASRLVFAYEAGPTGYVLHRYLTGKGLFHVVTGVRR